MILVDDVVADAQIGEGLERAPEPRVRARRSLAEDLGVREQRDPEVAPDEPATGGADEERDRRLGRELVGIIADDRLDSPQKALRAERLALVRERHEHTTPLAHHRRELVLRLREPSSRDRPGAAPRRRATASAGARRDELHRRSKAGPDPPPPTHSTTSSSCQTRSGGAVEERDEVGWLVLAQCELRVLRPFAGGEDDRLIDGMERALRER